MDEYIAKFPKNVREVLLELRGADEIRVWADKINKLREKVEVFGYFSKFHSGHPPTDARILLELAEHV